MIDWLSLSLPRLNISFFCLFAYLSFALSISLSLSLFFFLSFSLSSLSLFSRFKQKLSVLSALFGPGLPLQVPKSAISLLSVDYLTFRYPRTGERSAEKRDLAAFGVII